MVTEENKKNQWWAPALELFTQVSTWIVAPIVCALIFGKILDAHFGTKPVLFLVLAGIGFLITCIGIVRVIKNYTKKLKDIEDNSK